jgi:hypothetical protein
MIDGILNRLHVKLGAAASKSARRFRGSFGVVSPLHVVNGARSRRRNQLTSIKISSGSLCGGARSELSNTQEGL